jgi:hypothetical protein
VTWTRIGRSWTQAAVPVGGSSVALEIVRGWLVTDHFADTGGVNVLVAAPGNDQQPPCRPWGVGHLRPPGGWPRARSQ